MEIKVKVCSIILFLTRFCMFCAYTMLGYQVSVNIPLVLWFIIWTINHNVVMFFCFLVLLIKTNKIYREQCLVHNGYIHVLKHMSIEPRCEKTGFSYAKTRRRSAAQ